MKLTQTVIILAVIATQLLAADPIITTLAKSDEVSNSSAMSKLSEYSDAEIWYASMYEGSLHKSGSAILKLDKSTAPIILFLTSYEHINWTIEGFDSCNVVAIVADSYEAWDTPHDIEIVAKTPSVDNIEFIRRERLDEWSGIGKSSPSKLADFTSNKEYLEDNLTQKVTGFMGKYDCATGEIIPVPENYLIDFEFVMEIDEDSSFLFVTMPEEGYTVQWFKIKDYGEFIDPDERVWVSDKKEIVVSDEISDTLLASNLTEELEYFCKVRDESNSVVFTSEKITLKGTYSTAISKVSPKTISSFYAIARDSRLDLNLSKAAFSKITIFSVSGREIFTVSRNLKSGVNSISLPKSLAKGSYVVQVKNSFGVFSTSLMY
jgi:hypothetical protein